MSGDETQPIGTVEPLKVLDLFSGLGGFSQAFKDRGHKVLTVDIEPKFKPDLTNDVRTLNPLDSG